MPELPEVQTIVQDLKTKISGHKILGVNSDWSKIIKKPDYEQFEKDIQGLIIEKIERRGKNIIIYLSRDKALIIHLKMTGHPLVSTCWEFTKEKLRKKSNEECKKPDPIEEDPQNRFVHLGFSLDKGKNLLLSDLRKFATVRLVDKTEIPLIFAKLGPDAMSEKLTFSDFKKVIQEQKRSIKQVLLDQEIIAGIGNIYSDEILFEARINPKESADKLTLPRLKKMYVAMKKILKEAIEKRGSSISDYRDTAGEKGFYTESRRVYKKEKEECPRKCGGSIKRVKIGGRSSYFCPFCQKN